MSVEGITSILKGDIYEQFGKEILITQVRFETLQAMFVVDPEVQRKLDPHRRAEIRDFIVKCLKNSDNFYFSPFVFSARGGLQEVEGGVKLIPGLQLCILDGQHRAAALASALGILRSMKETEEERGQFGEAEIIEQQISNIMEYPVAMQIYLDLTQKEERQLFTDYNSERIDVHTGIVMKYDQRDQYIELTREIGSALKEEMDIEFELARLTVHSSAITSLTIMRRCLVALFEGKLAVYTDDATLDRNKQEAFHAGVSFFLIWLELFPKKMADRKKYVCGLTGIQIALAYTVYFLQHKGDGSATYDETISLLKYLKNRVTWKHDDPVFDHMYRPEKEKIINHSSPTAIKRTTMRFIEIIEEERGRAR